MREYRKRDYVKEKNRERCKKYRNKNPQKLNQYQRNYIVKLKMKVFEKLGNKCVRCGITDIRVLQIDHVHGHGNKDRIGLNRSQFYYYRKVLADTEGNYQILCANCNWIKKYENKENG